jgi:hypothetical protein
MSPLLIGGIVLVLILVVAYVAYHQGKRRSPHAAPKPLPPRRNAPPLRQASTRQAPVSNSATVAVPIPRDDRADQLYQSLLKKSFGDTSRVERLIQYEATRAPAAGRAEWIRSAVERWERDNR